eukprot:Opistho-1_new@58868
MLWRYFRSRRSLILGIAAVIGMLFVFTFVNSSSSVSANGSGRLVFDVTLMRFRMENDGSHGAAESGHRHGKEAHRVIAQSAEDEEALMSEEQDSDSDEEQDDMGAAPRDAAAAKAGDSGDSAGAEKGGQGAAGGEGAAGDDGEPMVVSDEDKKLLDAAVAEDAIDPLAGSLRHMSQQAKVYTMTPRVATAEALQPPTDLEAETTMQDIVPGALARHVFLDLCGSSLAAVRLIPRIYGRPDMMDTILQTLATLPEENAFQRILGYIRPTKTAAYIFTLSCVGECEIYLNPQGSSRIGLRRIGQIVSIWDPARQYESSKARVIETLPIELNADFTYAIDIIHKHSGMATVSVMWRLAISPQARSVLMSNVAIAFSIAERDCPACNDQFFINRVLPSLSGQHPNEHPILQSTISSSSDPSRPRAPRLPITPFYSNGPLPVYQPMYMRTDLGDRSLLTTLLPECPYDPGYLVRSRIGRYQGHQRIVFTDVFPADNTTMLNATGSPVGGTKVMDASLARLAASRLAETIAARASAEFPSAATSRYTLESISRIYKKFDRQKSRIRFFLEVTMRRGDGRRNFFSEYLYFVPIPPAGFNTYRSMCRPAGMEWDHRAFIHFILPVKNQGQWVQYFIADINAIYDATGDEFFDVTVVDYDSKDIDMELAMSRLAVPYRLVFRTGNFERAGGLQAGIEAIGATDGIVFTVDLHLSMPPHLLDMIRKHTIRGKQAFAPVVARLNCGETPLYPRGFWELSGYGLFSMYRSDFVHMGGMNTTAYKDVRGGEDLEMLDRVLMAGYEVERLRIPYFYHFFTGKRGLWVRAQQPTTTISATPTPTPQPVSANNVPQVLVIQK